MAERTKRSGKGKVKAAAGMAGARNYLMTTNSPGCN